MLSNDADVKLIISLFSFLLFINEIFSCIIMTPVTMKRKNSIYDARIAGLYDLAETIGKGHFAVVKAAKHVFTGERVAVKVIDKNKIDDSCKQHLFQEVRCMKLVQHPNIVRLYEVIDTQTKLFLILELGDYDMFDYIMRKGERGVEECEAQRFFCQIVNAIAYCHTVHVVHRDLKPENVVFMEKFGMAKLTDFGFSNLFTPGQHLDTSCGSLAYSAPEILLGDSYDAPAVDVWSLGVILYMLVCGRLPFQEANDSETLTKILDCSYVLPPHLSEDCKHVIKRMLVREPAKRATLKEIAALPWVKTGDFGHAQILPVVSRDHVNDDLHEQIIEQMVVGNIASAEDICKAVEMDDYSYITATYYLLLERHLRKERHEQAQLLLNAANESSICRADSVPSKMNNEASSPRFVQNPSETHHSQLDLENRSSTVVNNASAAASSSFDSISETDDAAAPETFVESSAVVTPTISTTRQKPKNLWRQRTCSMVQEESEDDLSVHVISSRSISPVHGLSPQSSYLLTTGSRKVSPAFMDLHDLAGRLTSGSGTSGRTTPDRSGSRSPSPIESRASPGIARYKSMPSLSRKLPTISSSPHLFGICEEGEENGPLPPTTGDRNPKTYSSSHSTCSAEISRHGRTFSGGDSVRKTSMNTYSSVRAICQRQAVVNVDVVKRYELPTSAVGRPHHHHHHHHHRRPTSASTNRRSASCSSSEASDDEERRLSLMRHARFCRQGNAAPFEKRWNDDDSDDDGGGVAGSSTSATVKDKLLTANVVETTPQGKDAGGGAGGKNGSSTNAARNFALALMERLSPIKENFSCSAVIGRRSPRPPKRTAHHHHGTTLDVKKLTLKLEKLVLAPIREIPPHLKRFFRHDDDEKRRKNCKNLCKNSLSSTVDASKTENLWLKSLSKAKSWGNLSPKKATIEIPTPPRPDFPFNDEKRKFTKKKIEAFTDECKEKPPILRQMLYCDCHQKTKKYR